MVTQGDVVGGYTLVRRLGSGGMGAVWEGRSDGGDVVALKVLHPAVAADPDARARLAREVESLHRLRGPRVSSVLDADVDGDTAFIVTELVDGLSLEQSVAEEGAFDPVDVHPLALGLYEAVTVVHEAGLLHRDLKPGNVMVTYDGPVLIDFGIAQVVDDARLTHTGFVTGTPGYLDPATLSGGALTASGDWFGWAAVLLFAATGRPPFGVGRLDTVIARMTTGRPDVDGLSPAVAAAFRAALEPQPDDRIAPESLLQVLENDALGIEQSPPPQATVVVPAPPGPVAPARTATMPAARTSVVPPPPGPLVGQTAASSGAFGSPAAPGAGNPAAETAVVAPRRAAAARPAEQAFAPGAHQAPPPIHPPGQRVPQARPGSEGPDGGLTPLGESERPEWATPPAPHGFLVFAAGALVVGLSVGWPGVATIAVALGFVVLTTVGLVERRTRRRRLAHGPRRSDGWAAAGWSLPLLAVGALTALIPLLIGAVVAACVWFLGLTLTQAGVVESVPEDWTLAVAPVALAAGLTAAWWVPIADATRGGARAAWGTLAPTRAVQRVWGLLLVLAAVVVVLSALGGGLGPVWEPLPQPPTPGGVL